MRTQDKKSGRTPLLEAASRGNDLIVTMVCLKKTFQNLYFMHRLYYTVHQLAIIIEHICIYGVRGELYEVNWLWLCS